MLTPSNVRIKQVLDEGTQNPIVARLTMQAFEVMEFAHLPKPQHDNLKTAQMDMTKRLLRCEKIKNQLRDAIVAVDRNITENAAKRPNHVPQILEVEGWAENFLYEAKNYLRTVLQIPNEFFGQEFTEASAFYDPQNKGSGALVEWARKRFGRDDVFTKMLVDEQKWTGEIIRKRNAVEHPGGRSGTLTILNIEELGGGKFRPPAWHRDSQLPNDIFSEMNVNVENMLTMAEEVLVHCVLKKMKHPIVIFGQIPEAERDPNCPIRLRAMIDQSKVKTPT